MISAGNSLYSDTPLEHVFDICFFVSEYKPAIQRMIISQHTTCTTTARAVRVSGVTTTRVETKTRCPPTRSTEISTTTTVTSTYPSQKKSQVCCANAATDKVRITDEMDIEVLKKDYDYLRDSPVRLLGYANEVGEAFRNIFPKLVVSDQIKHCNYLFICIRSAQSISDTFCSIGI